MLQTRTFRLISCLRNIKFSVNPQQSLLHTLAMNHQGHTANLYNLANIPMWPAINDYKFEHCHLFIWESFYNQLLMAF